MKKISFLFLCFLTLLFSSTFAGDKSQGVRVRPASPEILEVEPGRIVTGSFLISNHTGEEEEFTEELRLPIGWQEIASEEFPLRLRPDQQQVRVIAFFVPLTSPAGRYRVGYLIRSQRNYNIADSDSISIVVLPTMKLEIIVEARPEFVIAGEVYEVRFSLVNKSNISTTIKLTAKSNPVYPIKIEASELTLEAGKSQSIKLEIKTDEKLKQRIKNIVEIKVETEELKRGATSACQTVSVDVIPRVTGEFDPYHKLPIKVALIGAGQAGKGDFQAELSGRGSLDEEGKRGVDFLFRFPDIQEVSRYGYRDEYRLSYHQKHLDLHFGDRSYSLSPLTERLSYGRGVEANIYHGKFGSGAFYLETRWGEPKKKQVGAYLTYQFNNKLQIKSTFLSKTTGSAFTSKDYDSRIYSIQAEMKPNQAFDLDLEFGFCQSDREDKSNGLAFRMALQGQLRSRVTYSFENIYAGSKYFGYYNDTDYGNGTLTFPIYRKLLGNLGFRSYKNNLEIDSTRGIANREKAYWAGMRYSLPFGTHISLDHEHLIRKDYLFPANYNYEEEKWRLELDQTFGKLSLSTQIERGKFEDKLLAKGSDNLERYGLYASFRPSYIHSYSLYTRIGHGSFAGSPKRTKSLGISSSWNIRDIISFSLDYRKEKAGSERSEERDDIFSTFTYAFKNRHALIFRTQWSKSGENRKEELLFFLMYTIHGKIPVSKKKSTGVLKGRVYDEEKPGRPPIPKVLLTVNGATAITDNNGEFIFPSLVPGAHRLQVEMSSIGLNRVTSERLPILVEVEGGKTTEIEIGVVSYCTISGTVAVFASDSNKKLNHEDGIPNNSLFLEGSGEVKEKELGLKGIIVQITKGQEILQQVTDEEGGFSFDNMRSGKWTLKVYNQNLPAHHYLEQEEFQIEIGPGEAKKVGIKVLPSLRPVKIIDEGEISLQNK